jgi:hypothetical protein
MKRRQVLTNCFEEVDAQRRAYDSKGGKHSQVGACHS